MRRRQEIRVIKDAARNDLCWVLTCSDPNTGSVAPFGGLDPVFTPNPIAAGIPTDGVPVLMDISTSATTNGMTNRLHKEGKRLPAPWVMDGYGVFMTYSLPGGDNSAYVTSFTEPLYGQKATYK